MVRVNFTPGPKGDLGVIAIPRPLFHHGSSVSFSSRGAVSPECRSADNDVVAFLRVVSVVSVKMIIPSFVMTSDLCPDRVRGPEESLITDLEKNLGSG
ncbi:hypothetical protein BHE74_00052967 [Ensete ventricosum]|nr:hypothetical protein BHE74_00052967 [Ensete ventricosum]